MLEGKRFTCDYCQKPITTDIILVVDSVVAVGDRFHRTTKTTGENILYFHLATDRKAQYHKDGGCYKQWVMSDQLFNPHSVRPVLKQEVLENLAQSE